MEIYERIKELRKQHLKLSQEQFGEQLGVSRTVIKNIELGALARPEQKEPLYRLICETFHVNYKWLTSGDGEMFATTKRSFVEKLSEEYGLSITAQKIIESYLNLNEQQRTAVDDFIKSIAESIVDSPADTDSTGAVDEALDRTIANRTAKREQEAAHSDGDIASEIKKTVEQGEKILSPQSTNKK